MGVLKTKLEIVSHCWRYSRLLQFDDCTTTKMLGADRASWPAGVAWEGLPNLLLTNHLRLFLKIWPVFAFRGLTVWDRRTTKIEF
jgi:hypothetical protein